MRLQYARLKVDHGWVCRPIRNHSQSIHAVSFEQKQNLNEVENLYFHHAHQRGTKPYSLPSLIATTQSELPLFTNTKMSPLQSSLSFKVASPSLSRTHHFASSNLEGTTESPHSPISEVPQSNSSSLENHTLYPPGIGPLISMDVDGEDKHSPTPSSHSQTLSFPSPRTASHYVHSPLAQQLDQQHDMTANASGSADPPHTPSSPIPGWTYPSAPGYHSSSTTHHLDATSGQPNSKHEPYNFASSTPSSSTLTYDSFWSSRSFRGSNGIADGGSSQLKDSGTAAAVLESNYADASKVGA